MAIVAVNDVANRVVRTSFSDDACNEIIWISEGRVSRWRYEWDLIFVSLELRLNII